jgi:hypothetical protein
VRHRAANEDERGYDVHKRSIFTSSFISFRSLSKLTLW